MSFLKMDENRSQRLLEICERWSRVFSAETLV